MAFDKRHDKVLPGLVTPGDPRITAYNKYCWQLADLAAALPVHLRPDRMFLAAADFASLIDELRTQHDYNEDLARYADPKEVIYGHNVKFWVINAGTDDVKELNRLNRETPGALDFAERAKQFMPA